MDTKPVSADVGLPIANFLASPAAISGDSFRYYQIDESASNETPSAVAAALATIPPNGKQTLADPVSDAYGAEPENSEWLAIYALDLEPQPWMLNQPSSL